MHFRKIEPSDIELVFRLPCRFCICKIEADTLGEVWERAREEGWKIEIKTDRPICPECLKSKEEQND